MKNKPLPPPVWTVEFSSKAARQKRALPDAMSKTLNLLVGELIQEGPVQAEWHHYSKLVGADDVHHCHLNKGKPRYVAVWQVIDRKVRLMEIRYLGTHEKVHYNKF